MKKKKKKKQSRLDCWEWNKRVNDEGEREERVDKVWSI
jgi:hypothetical protein